MIPQILFDCTEWNGMELYAVLMIECVGRITLREIGMVDIGGRVDDFWTVLFFFES